MKFKACSDVYTVRSGNLISKKFIHFVTSVPGDADSSRVFQYTHTQVSVSKRSCEHVNCMNP